MLEERSEDMSEQRPTGARLQFEYETAEVRESVLEPVQN